MTVKEQMKADLLRYPSMIKNKWSCYHQWFAVTGNGLEWVNGELVDKFGEHKALTLNEALDNTFDSFIDDSKNAIEDFAQLLDEADCVADYEQDALKNEIKEDTIKTQKRELSLLKSRVKSLINYQNRMNDFSQTEEFFPLCDDSIICCLPEEGVNDDWKKACIEFYDWMVENFDRLDDETKSHIININTSWI